MCNSFILSTLRGVPILIFIYRKKTERNKTKVYSLKIVENFTNPNLTLKQILDYTVKFT